MIPFVAYLASGSSPVSMVFFDRFLFAFTIASHIILVSTSIGLIVIIAIAQFLSIRRNDKYYGNLGAQVDKSIRNIVRRRNSQWNCDGR